MNPRMLLILAALVVALILFTRKSDAAPPAPSAGPPILPPGAPPLSSAPPNAPPRPNTAVGFGTVMTAGALFNPAGSLAAAPLLACANKTIGSTAPCQLISAGLDKAYSAAEKYVPGAKKVGAVVNAIGGVATPVINSAASKAASGIKSVGTGTVHALAKLNPF